MGGRIYPNQKDSVEASEKLMRIILPILEKEHWPDWKKIIL